jgi:hypothetical protein
MLRLLIAGLTVLSVACGTADAATKKKKAHHAASAPVVSAPVYPYRAPTAGPLWANPNECFTDEGYGRYWPCGAGKDN